MARENMRLTSIGTNTTGTQATQTTQTATTTTTPCPTTRTGSFLKRITNWWDGLADPAKIRKETEADVLRRTRDNMLFTIIMGIVLFFVRGTFPTLYVGLGYVVLLAFFMENFDIRDAISHGESYREAERRAQRAGGRLLRSYLFSVVVLTALAVWVVSGAQWASNFPVLQTVSEKQIELVNETLDWFKYIFAKF